MKTIKKIESNGFYVFTGRSNANSCFIERLNHGNQFLIYANYFLKGYLKIYDYMLNKDGWIMVVKIKSKQSILAKSQVEDLEVWKIVSERMRLFLSTFVRVTNRQKRRTGALVHSSYERMAFENLQEAMTVIKKVRKQQLKLYSGRKKYRGLKTHYRISKNGLKGSIFLCSKDVRKNKVEGRKLGEVYDFIDLPNLVVQEFINFTLKKHPHHFHP